MGVAHQAAGEFVMDVSHCATKNLANDEAFCIRICAAVSMFERLSSGFHSHDVEQVNRRGIVRYDVVSLASFRNFGPNVVCQANHLQRSD